MPQVLFSSHPMPTEQRGRKAQAADSPCSPPFPLPDPGALPDLSHPMIPSGSPASPSRPSLPHHQMATPRLALLRHLQTKPMSSPGVHGYPSAGSIPPRQISPDTRKHLASSSVSKPMRPEDSRPAPSPTPLTPSAQQKRLQKCLLFTTSQFLVVYEYA